MRALPNVISPLAVNFMCIWNKIDRSLNKKKIEIGERENVYLFFLIEICSCLGGYIKKKNMMYRKFEKLFVVFLFLKAINAQVNVYNIPSICVNLWDGKRSRIQASGGISFKFI